MTEESIHCCAIGNIVKGKAIQVKARKTIAHQSVASIGFLADGSNKTANHPRVGLNHVINPGCSASRAISMKKNEEPHMLAAVSSKIQSNLSKGFTSLRKSELCFPLSLTSERYRHIRFTTKER